MKYNNTDLFFSIIIPTLNEEKTLPELLSDLTRQTFKNFEVIIVDANSEDQTLKKANHFKKDFLKFSTFNSQQKNVCYQRNLGSTKAVCNWIIFMDADNRLEPYFLQGIKYRIEVLNPDFLSSWIQSDTTNKKEQAVATLANLFIEVQKTNANPYVLESMLCCKKSSFKKLNGFDESLPWGEGSDLLRRAVAKKMSFKVARNPKYTYSLRRLRKQGTLKSIRNSATIELARLRNKKIPKERASYLYPMEGGKYWSQLEDKPTSRIEKILKKLHRIKPFEKITPPPNLITKLLNKLRN